jgi:hypothetical protein
VNKPPYLRTEAEEASPVGQTNCAIISRHTYLQYILRARLAYWRAGRHRCRPGPQAVRQDRY